MVDLWYADVRLLQPAGCSWNFLLLSIWVAFLVRAKEQQRLVCTLVSVKEEGASALVPEGHASSFTQSWKHST
jgi:hypothetical protein